MLVANSVSLAWADSVDSWEVKNRGHEFVYRIQTVFSRMNHSQGYRHRTSSCDVTALDEAGRLSDVLTPECFPNREIPQSVSEMFFSHADIPAEVISLWTPEYLLKQFARAEAKDKIDLQAVYDLNIEAARLWTEILECADGDAERARLAYAGAAYNCDQYGGTDLSERVIQLHAHVVSYVQTTNVAETVRRFQYADLDPDRGTLEFHPLLMQVFEEVIAVWFPTEKNMGSMRQWGRINTASDEVIHATSNIMQLIPLLASYSANPIGLWPNAIRGAHAYYLAKAQSIMNRSSQSRTPTFLISPSENFVRQRNANVFIEASGWVNPLVWLTKLFIFASDSCEDMKSVEPDVEKINGVFLEDQNTRKDLEIYASHSRDIVLSLRALASRYGVDRKAILHNL